MTTRTTTFPAMKVVSPPVTATPSLADDIRSLLRLRIATMSLITVAAGAILAHGGLPPLGLLSLTLLGSFLVAGGASVLNQYLEQDVDALMERTRNRPLPAGRMRPATVAAAGWTLSLIGLALLALTVNLVSATVAAVILFSYLFLYTPLKRLTPLNTVVGAVPGALPPLIGWTAVGRDLGPEAWALFTILFLWQLPHFLAIARLCRDDYARAGLAMLPVVEGDHSGPSVTGWQAFACSLLLLPASLAPTMLGVTGTSYFLAAAGLGVAFLAVALAFAWNNSLGNARRLLRASVLYLPLLYVFLVADKI